ncbi:hypothetical protein GW17_00059564 [Ensete ventricosum]|nr:hypothetical protein GW17_00059564 [Ensete ventricosum]
MGKDGQRTDVTGCGGEEAVVNSGSIDGVPLPSEVGVLLCGRRRGVPCRLLSPLQGLHARPRRHRPTGSSSILSFFTSTKAV